MHLLRPLRGRLPTRQSTTEMAPADRAPLSPELALTEAQCAQPLRGLLFHLGVPAAGGPGDLAWPIDLARYTPRATTLQNAEWLVPARERPLPGRAGG